MRRLAIVYGAPKTGTSHLFRTLIRHPECFGKDSRLVGDGLGEGEDHELSCIEPHDISLDDPDDTRGIDKRWEALYEEGKKYMVLKAPGYCMGWDYFSKLEIQ